MSYRRHPLEITPLVFGLVFLGIVAGWALFETGVVSGAAAAWVVPVVLMAAGALGLVLAATRPRGPAGDEYAAPDDTTAPQAVPTTGTEALETTQDEEHRDD